ncbi:MAG: hypothetical protein ACJ761_08670 [Chloroflexota bacterium]
MAVLKIAGLAVGCGALVLVAAFLASLSKFTVLSGFSDFVMANGLLVFAAVALIVFGLAFAQQRMKEQRQKTA